MSPKIKGLLTPTELLATVAVHTEITQKFQHIPTSSQTMAFAALAILGQRSAHSLPMGPVIAEPTKKQLVRTSYYIKMII